MSITTISSRQFNQDVSRAKKSTVEGPVFITDRGKTAHVLLNIKQYRDITQKKESIIDLVGMTSNEDIEFEPTPLKGTSIIPASFE